MFFYTVFKDYRFYSLYYTYYLSNGCAQYLFAWLPRKPLNILKPAPAELMNWLALLGWQDLWGLDDSCVGIKVGYSCIGTGICLPFLSVYAECGHAMYLSDT